MIEVLPHARGQTGPSPQYADIVGSRLAAGSEVQGDLRTASDQIALPITYHRNRRL